MKPKPPRKPTQRVNVDIPLDLLDRIDHVCHHTGIARQAWIRAILAGAVTHVDDAAIAADLATTDRLFHSLMDTTRTYGQK